MYCFIIIKHIIYILNKGGLTMQTRQPRRSDGIHAGGRKSLKVLKSKEWFSELLKKYETATLPELAADYGVSRTTICKYIRYAKEVTAQDNETTEANINKHNMP